MTLKIKILTRNKEEILENITFSFLKRFENTKLLNKSIKRRKEKEHEDFLYNYFL